MLEHEPIHVDESTPAGDAQPSVVAAKPKLSIRSIDAVTAAVALLIALAGGGLYAMHVRTSAGLQRMAAAHAGATDVDTLLSGGRESIAALSRSVKATREMVERFTSRHSDADDSVQLASAIRGPEGTEAGPRDPFIFKPAELTPQDAAPANPTPAAPDREQLRSQALAAARQLQVQSIIAGSSRRACLINGRLYFEGQAIDEQFTVQSISPDAVIVVNGEFRFELRLHH